MQSELDSLKQRVVKLLAENAEIKAENAKVKAENAKLKQAMEVKMVGKVTRLRLQILVARQNWLRTKKCQNLALIQSANYELDGFYDQNLIFLGLYSILALLALEKV